jgi:ComF family protein
MNVYTYAKHTLSTLARSITVPFCAHCYLLLTDDTVLCAPCAARIAPIVSTTLDITALKIMKVIAISDYKDPIKSLILAKSSSNIAAACQLGQLIWQHTPFQYMPCDIIVPVPLHWTRYAWRGYNQAEEMARVLAAHVQKPVAALVRRTRKTAFQSKIPFALRQDNVRDVFQLSIKTPSLYEGKHIIIVDDLMTSGATLRMVAKELYMLRPASVTAVVACRVI